MKRYIALLLVLLLLATASGCGADLLSVDPSTPTQIELAPPDAPSEMLTMVDTPLPTQRYSMVFDEIFTVTSYDVEPLYHQFSALNQEVTVKILDFYDGTFYYTLERKAIRSEQSLQTVVVTLCSYDPVSRKSQQIYEWTSEQSFTYSVHVNRFGVFFLLSGSFSTTNLLPSSLSRVLFFPHNSEETRDFSQQITGWEKEFAFADRYLLYYRKEGANRSLYCYDIEADQIKLLYQSPSLVTSVPPAVYNENVLVLEKNNGDYSLLQLDILSDYSTTLLCPSEIQNVTYVQQNDGYILLKCVHSKNEQRFFCSYLIRKKDNTVRPFFSDQNLLATDFHFVDFKNILVLTSDYNLYRCQIDGNEYRNLAHDLGVSNNQISPYGIPLKDGGLMLKGLDQKTIYIFKFQ